MQEIQMPANLVPIETIQSKIFVFRDQKVMVDRDLAEMYEVETKRLNEAVKRNLKRFPKDFMFKLNDTEKNELVANCDRFQNLKHSTSNPYVFTEHGVTMLASVLNSDRAIKVNIQIVRAFIEMKKIIISNEEIVKKISMIEALLLKHESDIEKHGELIGEIVNLLIAPQEENKKSIGFKTD